MSAEEESSGDELAKLSEGQLIDGRFKCLNHGWQFEGEGKCVKIAHVGYSSSFTSKSMQYNNFF
ncbi:hypothetical protein JHK87_048160 [Glycine soja]|nr:hypothetical protein JHK87_048160 [Glycine soja]